jgi:transposase-like protein
MILYLQDLLDDEKVYQKVRELRWPDGQVRRPHCDSDDVVRKGYHNNHKARRRYRCQGHCCAQFDDLTDTVFEGHHQPLEVWILCLYLMGLNPSNRQIAAELGLNKDDVQSMTRQLREGVVAKKRTQPERRAGVRRTLRYCRAQRAS